MMTQTKKDCSNLCNAWNRNEWSEPISCRHHPHSIIKYRGLVFVLESEIRKESRSNTQDMRGYKD